MTALAVPADYGAEVVVVACAVATVHGAALATERLSPGDFWFPAHGRLLAAAAAIGGVLPEAERIAACAATTGLAAAEVGALVDGRNVMWDLSGSFARRVLDAARRRRIMHVCEAAYRRLGEGGTADEALDVLRAAS